MKFAKLGFSIFIGLDVAVAVSFLMSYLRVSVFGRGGIPGGGDAIDYFMILLIPVFVGWVAGDRLYYFLTYSERRERKLAEQAQQKAAQKPKPTRPGLINSWEDNNNIWADTGWQDEPAQAKTKSTATESQSEQPK